MEFYREGFLNKAGKGLIQTHLHSWRPRYFVLDRWNLKYYKSKEMLPENMLGCIEVVEMESVSVLKNEKNAFQITTKSPSRRTYYMSGRNEDEIHGWIKCLTMAKSKYIEKQKKTSSDVAVPSMYDEPKPPSKPSRSLIVSGTGFLDPPQSPASPTTPASPTAETSPGAKPVLSAYGCVEFPTTDGQATEKPNQDKTKDEDLYAEPTYDIIDEKAVSKSKKLSTDSSNPATDLATDLYDMVDIRTTKMSPSKKLTMASDPLPHATVPPPLPARLPSMSGEENETIQENKTPEANVNVLVEGSAFGLYEDVGSPDSSPAIKTESRSENSQPKVNAITSLYDEVGSPGTGPDMAVTTNSGSEKSQPQGNMVSSDLYDEVGSLDMPPVATESEISQPQGYGIYDEVVTPDLATEFKKKEVESEFPKDPTHVYAKPQKSTSMKRGRSKRKLIPGLMDVGEVDIDIEQEAAGGRETLEPGMTKPQGDRFAIEDLSDALAEFDQEVNNNEYGEMLPDFDVNQSASAFEVLRMFFEKYE